MADEETIVVIEGASTEADDAQLATEQARGADGKFVRQDEPVDDLVKQFKDQAEQDRRRAEAAERHAAEQAHAAERARADATAARTEVVDSQYDTVVTGIGGAEAEIASAKRDYKAASEAGDWDKQAEAADRLAAARARHVRLDEAKAELEARKAAPVSETRRPEATETRRAPQPADQFEAYVANRTEPTAKWLREHKDWVTDPKKNAKLTGAHYDALAEGHAVDTQGYFDHVETVIGLRKDGANGQSASRQQQQRPARRPSVPVAPVQASGGGTNGGGTEVRLKKFEADAAVDGTHVWNYDDPSPQKRFKKGDPIGVQEFARRKLEMQKDGRYDKSYTES